MPAGTTQTTTRQGWHADLLWFENPDQARLTHLKDGLIITETNQDGIVRIVDLGPYSDLIKKESNLAITHWPNGCIAPGFVDMHIHYPQTDVIASPADGLLPWLNDYTFPHEQRFSNPQYASSVANFFIDELFRNGVTTAMCFATIHSNSVDAIMAAALNKKMRLIAGRVLQDRNSPEGLRDANTELSLLETEQLIQRWHRKHRLGYAITPRFAPTSTPQQLLGAGELAQQYKDTWIQSHLSENQDEIDWVRQLYPQAKNYTSVYKSAGLLRKRAVYAHGIHLDDDERKLLHEHETAIAISPSSNLFLASGFYDYQAARRTNLLHGLASDVGGGTSFSPFHTMHAAYTVARQSAGRTGTSLSPHELWWQHTAGAANALDLKGMTGNLLPGCEADFVVLNPKATPLLARRTGQSNSLDEWLFSMIVLGDDRLIEQTVIQAQVV
jgi:guanine deaminase